MRRPGNIAFVVTIVSGVLSIAAGTLPRPWSTFGHIDIAELLAATPIFNTHWPYWTFPFEYHPVVGWGSALLSYVTNELVLVTMAWVIVAALCARAVGSWLGALVGDRRATVFWAVAPQLVLFGARNFDVLAILTVVGAVALHVRAPVRAGLAAAVGGATKLFPLAVVPPLALMSAATGRRREAVLFVVASAVGLLVIDLPAVIAPFSLLHTGVTPYSVATWNVDSIWFPVAVLLDPFVPPGAADAFIAVLTGGGLVLSYALLVLVPAWRRPADARLPWLGIVLIAFWTRLRSPQYAIWLLPAFALYVPDVRLLLFMFVGDAVSFFAVFALRGIPRDVLGSDAYPLLMAIMFGVIVRQVAMSFLLTRLVARRRDPPSNDATR